MPILQLEKYCLTRTSTDRSWTILRDISLEVERGEIVGLVGHSGSGKSMLLRSILGLNDLLFNVSESGSINYFYKDGAQIDILQAGDDLRNLRRFEIGLIFQHSQEILNPRQTIGHQIIEKIGSVDNNTQVQIYELLEEVELIPGDSYYKRFPHELSGGQIQRALIAMALVNDPDLLLADEPVSALDKETQYKMLDLIRKLSVDRGLSLILVSHDGGLVRDYCNRIIAIEDGELIPYRYANTDLVDPRPASPQSIENKILFELDKVNMTYNSRSLFGKNKNGVEVFSSLSMKIYEGEILCVTGKTGSGKSTLGKLLVGLETSDSGQVKYMGKSIYKMTRDEVFRFKHSCQFIFQDPLSSMAPHRTMVAFLGDVFSVKKQPYDETIVMELLTKVALDSSLLSRRPKELSGGQRQRFMIARALLMGASFLICDEILASVDSRVSDKIIQLLIDLNKDEGITFLYITHDIEMANRIAHRIINLDTEIRLG